METTPDATEATFIMIQAEADGELISVSGISSEPVDYLVKSLHSSLTPFDIKQSQEKDSNISVTLTCMSALYCPEFVWETPQINVACN